MTDPDLALPSAIPAGDRRPRRRWSLRRRLIVGIVVLIAVLSVAIGGISTAVLRGTLVQRLDDQLTAQSERTGNFLGGPNGPTTGTGNGSGTGSGSDRPPPVNQYLLGAGAGAIGAVIVDGAVVGAGYITDVGGERVLTAAQQATLVAVDVDGKPEDAVLGGDFGTYRAIATTLPDGAIVVVGLPLAEVDDTVTRLALIITGVTLAGLLVAVLLGSFVVRVALRPLDRVVATAGRVSELELAAGAVSLPDRVPAADADGTTEVGRVGAALNRLLARVESALQARHESEETLRRFVADASHELRTPLASIRGYSEFVRRDTEGLDPDQQHSLARIDSESQRMAAIVEDLLLLARLDSGPGIANERADLALITVDALSDAHAAGPDHTWELDIAGEEVPVDGDPARLQQVVANLLTNARVHTPAGTTVVAAVEARDGRAILTVSDDGPGIPAELQPRLFERFVRGDDSRARVAGAASGGSTGLGLAIVEALVDAHGGEVRVESEPGRTVFTIDLPLAS